MSFSGGWGLDVVWTLGMGGSVVSTFAEFSEGLMRARRVKVRISKHDAAGAR
jgi:hypothetical protein